jgi:hypothetical protein
MTTRSYLRTALWTWAILLVVVAMVVQFPRQSGKLYPTFVAAGEHFGAGEPLYDDPPAGRDIYRYSPLAAAIFAPWAGVPAPVGAVLWRWAQAIALLLALRAWSRTAEPAVPWPVLALLCLPLAAGNVFNAQLNPLVLALLLAGLAAFSRERYTLAAIAVVSAALFKVYPLAVGLLLGVVEPRRFAPRLVASVVVVCALPFALQDDRYVAQQFADWMERVGSDDRTEQPMHRGYHDFQKLLRCWGAPVPLPTYRAMEVVAGGLAAALLVWGRRRGWDRRRQVQACAALGLVWCTLFGPATETATYILLAPIAAHAVMAVTGRPLWQRVWAWGGYGLLVSVPVALWFPASVSGPYRALTPQAHGAFLLLIWMVWQLKGGVAPERVPTFISTMRQLSWGLVPSRRPI